MLEAWTHVIHLALKIRSVSVVADVAVGCDLWFHGLNEALAIRSLWLELFIHTCPVVLGVLEVWLWSKYT